MTERRPSVTLGIKTLPMHCEMLKIAPEPIVIVVSFCNTIPAMIPVPVMKALDISSIEVPSAAPWMNKDAPATTDTWLSPPAVSLVLDGMMNLKMPTASAVKPAPAMVINED
eukprot:SAG31_NODE_17173_length_680_cov_1.339071_2_plen_111_part_01